MEPSVGGLVGSALTLLVEARLMDERNPEAETDEFRERLNAAITSVHQVLEPPVPLPTE
jgi:hypothetical protein